MPIDPDVFGAPASKVDADVFKLPNKPKAAAQEKPDPVTDFKGNLQFATPLGTLDTGIPLPEFVNKGLAQLGSGLADWSLGSRQIMASNKPKTASDLVTGQTEASRLQQEAAEKRKFDKPLNEGWAGAINNFAGKVLPSFAAPQIAGAPIASGVLAGGVVGAFEPTAPGESRTANTVTGAGLGGVIPGGAAIVRKVASASVDPTAQLALKYNIPVSPADLSSNRFVKGLRSVLDDVPIIGMPGASLKAKQQAALNEAVGDAMGAKSKSLMPDVMSQNKQRMVSEFDRIWGSNSLEVDANLFQRLQSLRSSAQDMPAEQGRRVLSQIDDFLSRAQPNQAGAPTIPGDTANAFQKWLREKSAGNTELAKDAGELRKAIISAFNRSVSPEDAAALTQNRSQYKAFKTVEDLLDKAAVGMGGRITGDVPAALLPGAVKQSYQGLSSQTSQPALAEIAQVAGRYLTDRTPQTGGSPRAALQNAGLLGGLTAGGALSNPLAAAAGAGTATGLNWALNSPTLGKAMVSPKVSSGLLSLSKPELDRMAAEAMGLTLQRAPLGLLQPGLIPALSALE